MKLSTCHIASRLLFCFLLFCYNNTSGQSVDVTQDSSESAEQSSYTLAPRSLVMRGVPDSVVDRYKSDKDFEYANDPAYWERPKQKKANNWDGIFDFFASDLFRALLYLLLAAIVVYVIYRVVVVNRLFVFSRASRRRIIETASQHEEITEETLEARLKNAVAQNDYRSAVRFLYLKTLYGLNSRNLISMHADTTNEEYLEQLKQNKLFNDFKFLTRIYEYVWYGEFNITPEQFSIAHTGFKKFQDKLI